MGPTYLTYASSVVLRYLFLRYSLIKLTFWGWFKNKISRDVKQVVLITNKLAKKNYFQITSSVKKNK